MFQLRPSKQNDDNNRDFFYSALAELACRSLQKCSVEGSKHYICAEDLVNGNHTSYDNMCSLLEVNCNAKGHLCKYIYLVTNLIIEILLCTNLSQTKKMQGVNWFVFDAIWAPLKCYRLVNINSL